MYALYVAVSCFARRIILHETRCEGKEEKNDDFRGSHLEKIKQKLPTNSIHEQDMTRQEAKQKRDMDEESENGLKCGFTGMKNASPLIPVRFSLREERETRVWKSSLKLTYKYTGLPLISSSHQHQHRFSSLVDRRRSLFSSVEV